MVREKYVMSQKIDRSTESKKMIFEMMCPNAWVDFNQIRFMGIFWAYLWTFDSFYFGNSEFGGNSRKKNIQNSIFTIDSKDFDYIFLECSL